MSSAWTLFLKDQLSHVTRMQLKYCFLKFSSQISFITFLARGFTTNFSSSWKYYFKKKPHFNISTRQAPFICSTHEHIAQAPIPQSKAFPQNQPKIPRAIIVPPLPARKAQSNLGKSGNAHARGKFYFRIPFGATYTTPCARPPGKTRSPKAKSAPLVYVIVNRRESRRARAALCSDIVTDSGYSGAYSACVRCPKRPAHWR